jgi:Zn-dependent protease with chaperone function
MFNNVIYFIIVLLIFNLSYPDNTQEHSFTYSLVMHIISWLVFAGYCQAGFRRLLGRLEEDTNKSGRLTNEYQNLILRVSVLAIFLFALDVYMFHLKYWLRVIPGSDKVLFLQGIEALTIFFFYLGTIWYFAYPAYRVIFQALSTRQAFMISNLRLNLPILFPWLTLSLFYDLVSFSPWAGLERFLNEPVGQILFFAVFLIILMIFMPRFIQYGWGCKPVAESDRVMELEAFLQGRGFRYRNILRWPIFEGRVMTAGIMGIVPRYRYILLTDALMEMLTLEELKAVTAHEMGHAKYLHMLFYILFILGYMVLSMGLFEPDFYFLLGAYVIGTFWDGETSPNLFYLLVSLPILATMVVYFRYVMGFFMRHFERQADLYSAVIMKTPRATISSLEKIAFLSGKRLITSGVPYVSPD